MYIETIRREWVSSEHRHDLARKIFISYPTKVFSGKEDIEFDIIDNISNFFNIPFSSIQVVGSAKTGYSYINQRDFQEGQSDLDIAIINQELFLFYMELCYKVTKGYKDLSKFPRDSFKSNSQDSYYKKCITNGQFRPDLMPACNEKRNWYAFFNRLSNKYYKLFKNINAGIYLSQHFFEFKQVETLEIYMERMGGKLNDSI
jgi:hypothetical protein